jgi:hypothetical protein
MSDATAAPTYFSPLSFPSPTAQFKWAVFKIDDGGNDVRAKGGSEALEGCD